MLVPCRCTRFGTASMPYHSGYYTLFLRDLGPNVTTVDYGS